MKNEWPLILDYHDVHATTSSRYAISASALERQLGALLDRGYVPLSLAEAVDSGPFGRSDAARRSFTITFDDAYASFKLLAMPILERLDLVGATAVFVPTGLIDTQCTACAAEGTDGSESEAHADVPYLTWRDLTDLAQRGVSIESHGHAHTALSQLSYEAALADIERSKRELTLNGLPPRYLAVPFGWRSNETKRAIAEAGFDAAFSVFQGGLDRFEIRRVPIYGGDGAWALRLKHSGHYFALYDALSALAGKRRDR